MCAVNRKSKAKRKTPAPATSLPISKTGWYRFQFWFKTVEQCNRLAMPIAAVFRAKHDAVYFARYTNAFESRLDLFVKTKNPTVLTQGDVDGIMHAVGGGKTRWFRVDGPAPCEGSELHGAGFELAMRFVGRTFDMDDMAKTELWVDILHWTFNMVGLDYIDEARCNLRSLDRIMAIFDQSIRLGNKLGKVARKVRQSRRGNPRNN